MSPLRSVENGLHVSGETTRIASHAFNIPRLNGASDPPASAASTSPLRTIQNACPMAWLDEAQAVHTVYAGPVMPYRMEIQLAAALAMMRGIVSGFNRDFDCA